MGKILVALLHGIGDSLMAAPALHALKKKYPDSSLTLLTINHPVFRELWENNPDVDDVLFSSLHRNPRYGHPFFWFKDYWTIKKDIRQAVRAHGFTQTFFIKMFLMPAKIYSFLPFQRYKKHKTYRIAEELGVSLESNRYSLDYSHADRAWANQFIKEHRLDKDILVGLHFRGSSVNKSLSQETCKTITDFLVSHGYQVVIFDSADQRFDLEKDAVRGIVHYFSDSILHSAALVDQCQFLVCIDSGVGHVAAARNKKLFSIYFRKSWMNNSLALGDQIYPHHYTDDDTLVKALETFITS